jgi:hypothetical protein
LGFKDYKVKANDLHNITFHKTYFNIHHYKNLRSTAVHWLLWYLCKKDGKTTLTATTEFYESWRTEVKQFKCA